MSFCFLVSLDACNKRNATEKSCCKKRKISDVIIHDKMEDACNEKNILQKDAQDSFDRIIASLPDKERKRIEVHEALTLSSLAGFSCGYYNPNYFRETSKEEGLSLINEFSW